MKTIPELQEERSHLVRSADDLKQKAEKENRGFTAEEKRQINDWLEAGKALTEQIKQIEDDQALAAKVTEARNDLARVDEPRVGLQGVATETRDSKPVIEMGYRNCQLRAFTNGTRQENEENAYIAGQWVRAFIMGNHSAERVLINKFGINTRAHSEGVNTAGGFLVPTQMEQAYIDLKESYGVFRRHVNVLPMATDTATIPRRTSGLTAYFIGENSEATASDTAWDQVQLVAKKVAVLTKVSSELDEDAIINLGDMITREVAQAHALLEDTCGFTGAGTAAHGSIRGLTTLFDANVGSYTGAVDATSGHDTFAEVDTDDLARLMGTLPEYAAMGDCAFYCSRPCAELVFGALKASAGGNTMTDLNGKVVPSYLSYPIRISQLLPTSTGTINNTTMLLFGDLSMAATMGARRGLRLKRSEDRYLEFDQIGILATQRFDIVIHDIGSTSAAGPIVALMGNT